MVHVLYHKGFEWRVQRARVGWVSSSEALRARVWRVRLESESDGLQAEVWNILGEVDHRSLVVLLASSSLDGKRLELVERFEEIAPRCERAEPQPPSGHSKTSRLNYDFCLAETLSSAAASAAPSWILTIVGAAAVRLRDIQPPAHSLLC